jgi:hypothetical protein
MESSRSSMLYTNETGSMGSELRLNTQKRDGLTFLSALIGDSQLFSTVMSVRTESRLTYQF